MYNSNEAVKENWGQFVYCTCTCVSLLLESSTSLLLGNWSDNNLGHKLYRFMTVIYLWANDKSKEKRRVWIQWKITIFHICDFLNKWNLKFTGEKKNPWALDAEDSWSVWDAGRYFFPIALGTKQMGCHLIRSGAMDGAFQLLATWPRLLRAKGRISLLFSLSPWSSASWNYVSGLLKAHLSASFWNMQTRTLREKNFQTPL